MADTDRVLERRLAGIVGDGHVLTDPDLRTNAVRHSREMRLQIRPLLDAAIAAGELVPADSEHLAQAVYTTYSGALLTWAIDGHGDLADWLRQEIDFLLAPYRPSGAT